MIEKKQITITSQREIFLGKQGENEVTEILFPQESATMGETWALNHRRATDTAAYPVELEKRGNDLVWLVTAGDTAVPGRGEAELICYGSDGQVQKSRIYNTAVRRSLLTGGSAPVSGWSKPTGTVYIRSNGLHDVSNYANAQVDVPTSTGGITPSGTLEIGANGTFNVTNYESARVDVPVPDGYIKPEGTKTVNTNGTHDVEAYKQVTVNVPTGSGVSGTVAITSNGVHDVASYEKANVNVPVPEGYIQPSGTKSITSNGTHSVREYDQVNVNVASTGTGTDTSDATAAEGDVLYGKTFYAGGEKNTGTVKNCLAITDDAISEVQTSSDGTQAEMTADLGEKRFVPKTLPISFNLSRFGNADQDDVVAGKTFTSTSGIQVRGTHKCSGLDTSDATLTESLCPSGKTFYAGGEKKTGTMKPFQTPQDEHYVTANISTANGKFNAAWTSPTNMYARAGEAIAGQMSASRFGNATAADVVKGKTFTSANGLNLTGTYEAPSGGGGGNIYRTTATLDSNYSTASWKKLCTIPFLGENISDSGLFVILNRVSTTAESKAVSLCAASNGAYFNGNYFASVIHGNYGASVDTLSSYSYSLSSSSTTSYTRIYADSSGNLYIRPDGGGTIFAAGEYVVIYGIF